MRLQLGKKGRKPSHLINYTIMIALTIFTLYPMVLVFLNSVKTA